MITRLNFIHIRSTRGLIKKSRRLVKKLRFELKDEGEEKDKFKVLFEAGDEKGVYHVVEDLLDTEEHMEELLQEIKTFQTQAIYDELKHEKKEENTVEELLSDKDLKNLDSNLRNKLMELKSIVKIISNKFSNTLHEMTVENIDIEHFRDQFVKYVNVWPDRQIGVHLKRKMTDEKSGETEVRHDEDKLDDEIDKFIKLIKHPQDNSKEIHDLADKILADARELVKEIDNELHLAKHITHLINIIHIRLLHRIYIDDPNKLEELKKEGFSEDKLIELNKKMVGLVHKSKDGMHHEYKLGRYVQNQN